MIKKQKVNVGKCELQILKISNMYSFYCFLSQLFYFFYFDFLQKLTFVIPERNIIIVICR